MNLVGILNPGLPTILLIRKQGKDVSVCPLCGLVGISQTLKIALCTAARFYKNAETVVLLSKGNISSQSIRVEFSLEDMDMSSFQQRATYDQIHEWVQEKYGFHVTHLNIAQVKRKYGIIERENYNKPKSHDSRQPGCPEEKMKAIEEALKQFQMI